VKVLVVWLALCATAHAQPDNSTLVYVGIAMAPVDYVAGTALHEGSHALAAKLVGADVDELHVFPPGRDPHANVFRFGWTYVHGLHTKADQITFLIAPKITDAVLLGGFAALAFTSAWPSNKYGQLALTVVATGLWVDFAKDVVLFAPQNDVTKIFKLWCFTGWRQIPARAIYAAMDVGFGYVVFHGYTRLFDRNDPVIVPVTRLAF
jgi:Peptidase M50B-like